MEVAPFDVELSITAQSARARTSTKPAESESHCMGSCVVVEAFSKFLAALNPTVDFRRRDFQTGEPSSANKQRLIAQRAVTGSPDMLEEKYIESRSGCLLPRATRTKHGNKTYYLTRSLS